MKLPSLGGLAVLLVFSTALMGCSAQPTQPINTNTTSDVNQPAAPTPSPAVTMKAAPSTNTNTAKPKPKVVAPPPAPKENSISLAMAARNDSAESGTATLTDVGGKTKVVISVTHAPSIDPQPAYIYTGSCGSGGKIRHTLNYLIKGQSSTMLLFSLDQILMDKPLSINVLKNQSDMLTSVSCVTIE